ncbi:MAG TPA: ImmA/IrrE family metallo-endopeptidase [Allosphingosinicella sp.]|jgi:Zn-dependent peptidase ImmA (M78 family)|nr:ImmA/IrrE family metallo-endopeptidase [Allosphingosinicella sp.]
MSELEHLLRKYRSEYPVDIVSLIQNLGVGVEPEADLPEKISGQVQRQSDGTYIIRANRREHEYRRRFTMAHELGHFVLHRSILDRVGGVNDNTMYRTDIHAPLYNSHIHRVHEQQANSFAANLLMPEECVRKVHLEESGMSPLPDGSPWLASMYRVFHVSPSAMRWRLRNLDLPFAEPVTEPVAA